MFLPRKGRTSGGLKYKILTFLLFWIRIRITYTYPKSGPPNLNQSGSESLNPQSRQSAELFLSRRNWDSPTPHRQAVCPHSLVPKGRGTLACVRGGEGVPIPTRGHTLWYSMNISILWLNQCLCNAWMPRGRSEAPMPKGNWVMMPKGVLSPGDTISVTKTNPHSNTPDTEKATRNLGHAVTGIEAWDYSYCICAKACSAFCTNKKENWIFLIYKEI